MLVSLLHRSWLLPARAIAAAGIAARLIETIPQTFACVEGGREGGVRTTIVVTATSTVWHEQIREGVERGSQIRQCAGSLGAYVRVLQGSLGHFSRRDRQDGECTF